MSKELTAEDILGADDIVKKLVEVPEWGGHVFVRVMSGFARDQWEAQSMLSGDSAEARMKNLRARLIAATACNEKGAMLFTAKQVTALGNKSSRAMDRVFAEAAKLNELTKEDVDSLVGESEGGPSDDSGSDSPDT